MISTGIEEQLEIEGAMDIDCGTASPQVPPPPQPVQQRAAAMPAAAPPAQQAQSTVSGGQQRGELPTPFQGSGAQRHGGQQQERLPTPARGGCVPTQPAQHQRNAVQIPAEHQVQKPGCDRAPGRTPGAEARVFQKPSFLEIFRGHGGLSAAVAELGGADLSDLAVLLPALAAADILNDSDFELLLAARTAWIAEAPC